MVRKWFKARILPTIKMHAELMKGRCDIPSSQIVASLEPVRAVHHSDGWGISFHLTIPFETTLAHTKSQSAILISRQTALGRLAAFICSQMLVYKHLVDHLCTNNDLSRSRKLKFCCSMTC